MTEQHCNSIPMPKRVQDRPTEDDLARAPLGGPRGSPELPANPMTKQTFVIDWSRLIWGCIGIVTLMALMVGLGSSTANSPADIAITVMASGRRPAWSFANS